MEPIQQLDILEVALFQRIFTEFVANIASVSCFTFFGFEA